MPEIQTGSQSMLGRLSSTILKGGASSRALRPILFADFLFEPGAKTSEEHQCRATIQNAAYAFHSDASCTEEYLVL